MLKRDDQPQRLTEDRSHESKYRSSWIFCENRRKTREM